MSFPQMMVTFSPAWWRARYGMTFDEPVWRDPIARTERDREMRRLLHERFGDVGLGEADPRPTPNLEAYGHRFMAAFWGCATDYPADQPPAAMPLPDAAARLGTLAVPDPETSPVIQRARAEARRLQDHYGACEGEINWGGPLNNAVSVFGDEILLAIAAEPDLARRALQVMAEALMVVYRAVTCSVSGRNPDVPRTDGGIGNCPVCMISPASYREVVLPADLWVRRHYVNFGIHHCGALHPYVEVYRPLRPKDFDTGWLSDRRAVRQAYPTTPTPLLLEASALAGKSRAAVDALVARMIDEAGPPHLIPRILVHDVGLEVADETVRDFMTVPLRFGGFK